MAAHVLQVLAVVLPVVACAMILGRMGLRWFQGLARWSRGSGRASALVAAALSATMVTALAWAWWPRPDSYRPIGPGERGVLTTLLRSGVPAAGLTDQATAAADAPPPGAAARKRLSSGRPLVAMLPEDGVAPTKDEPALAMVLVPTAEASEEPVPLDETTGADEQTGSGATSSEGSPTADATDTTGSPSAGATSSAEPAPDDDAWVFPFDQPLAPDEGDTQALAVNTTDGSVTYDLAFALIWAEDDEVLNVNEAHAYASCSDCVAVAVAFQVVLINEDAQVVVPQNLAVAANYDCYRCITAAIANQLVLTVPGEPGEEELKALGEVWTRLLEFARGISAYSLAEINAQLEAFKAEITTILGAAPMIDPEPSSTTSPDESPTEGSSPSTTSPTPSTPVPTTASPTSPSSSTPPAPIEETTTTTTPSPSSSSPAPTTGSTSTTTSPTPTSPTPTSPTPTSPAPSESPSSSTTGAASPSATSSP